MAQQSVYIGFRVSGDILAFLRARQEEGEGLGAVARECIERYAALLSHGLREIQELGLTEDEVMKVMEALNGVLYTPQTAHLVWADLADRIGEGHPLTQKIRSLSPAGRFALVDAAERFWRGDREVLKEIIGEGQK